MVVPWFQNPLISAPITAGLLGLLLGPNAFGIIQFSEHFGNYENILDRADHAARCGAGSDAFPGIELPTLRNGFPRRPGRGGCTASS